MRLPRIFAHFKQGQVFTIREAREKLGTTGNALRKRLSELAARGYIYPIRQGMYRMTRIGERPEKMPNTPFAVAAKLTPYCYVGYSSALQLHAGETPKEGDVIYVVSPTKFNSFRHEKMSYFWCQNPEPHGLETYLLKQYDIEYPVLATNFEKSIIDCLRRPTHCPSFGDLVRLCRKINNRPAMDRLLKYASDGHAQTLYNRIGFLLDALQHEWPMENAILARIEEKMSKKQTEWPILFNAKVESNTDHKIPLYPNLEKFEESKSRWKVNFNEPIILGSSGHF